MKILLVSATSFEMAAIVEFLIKNAKKKSFFEFEFNGHSIFPLVTGVGAAMTAFNLARFTKMEEIDIAINIGLAGAYDKSLVLGDVVQVIKDRFADLGVEEIDQSFTDVFQLELIKQDNFPFMDGWLINDKNDDFDKKSVISLTVNKVSGNESSIKRILTKYNAHIESMEGAGFSYAAKCMDLDHVQIRAISNFVEPRNKANWSIDLAINNLTTTIVNYLTKSRI